MVIKHPRYLFADMPIKLDGIQPIENHKITPAEEHIQWRGLWVRFENGRILSLQAHPFNYCSNGHYKDALMGNMDAEPIPDDIENWLTIAETVEIATWDELDPGRAIGWGGKSNLQPLPGGDTVAGWVGETTLVRFMYEVLSLDKAAGYVVLDLEKALPEFDWSEDNE